MANRKSTDQPLPESETAVADGTIPPGVEADVTVKYRQRVNAPPRDPGDALSDVLQEELDATFAPLDPLSSFLDQWSNFAGYNCVIVRLADPAARRMPGNTYARACFEVERLGDTPFDPVNFVGTLQMLNGNSGGVFRCFLTDEAGQLIPGARIERFAIADPPRGARVTMEALSAAPQIQAPQPREREQSAIEKQLAGLQTRLLETALNNALNPPPAAPAQPLPMADEDRLALMLFKQGDLLSNVIQKVANAVQAPDAATAPATWKDKAFDYLMQNPAVGNQVAGIADRLVLAITNILPGNTPAAPAPAPPVSAAQQPYVDQAPEPPPAQHTAPAIDVEESTEEEENMAILDELFTLIVSADPITGENPVFAELATEFPERFPVFVNGLATAPHAIVITMTKAQSPLYKSLLDGPDGARLAGRIAEIQALAKQWIEAAKQAKAQVIPETK